MNALSKGCETGCVQTRSTHRPSYLDGLRRNPAQLVSSREMDPQTGYRELTIQMGRGGLKRNINPAQEIAEKYAVLRFLLFKLKDG